jgi:lysyl-tRNA synthetase class 2
MEPYLTPFQVSSPDLQEKGYLVTSPEYSLKQALGKGLDKIYEISQVYRSGEKGSLHTAEFLMLEFYAAGIDEFGLMDVCIELFLYLDDCLGVKLFPENVPKKISMPELFHQYLGISDSKKDLLDFLNKSRKGSSEEYENMRYDELFFLVFLNEIEPHLKGDLIFLYNYPEELASLARVIERRARRFEIYWKGSEIGNAFYECTSQEEMKKRFQEEQLLRKSLSKEVFEMDANFMNSLEEGIPESSGIAIGLDRLFMIYAGHTDLKYLSPYFGSL